jgi:hypothetical protein
MSGQNNGNGQEEQITRAWYTPRPGKGLPHSALPLVALLCNSPENVSLPLTNYDISL